MNEETNVGQVLQEEQEATSGALSAQNIQARLAGPQKVGCFYLVAMALAMFTAYAAGRWWLGGADYGVVLAGLTGLAAFVGTYMRNFHVLTATAWLILGLMALGLSPMVYTIVFPQAPVGELPGWMQRQEITWGLVGGAVVGLGLLLVQMRRTISTPEIFYTIQVQAAAKRSKPKDVAAQLEAALGVLRECAELGVWPSQADFLDVQDAAIAPHDHSGLAIKPMLAVRARASKDDDSPWLEFGKSAYLREPESWTSTIPSMAPVGVGQVFCDGQNFHFVSLRPGAERLKLPLASITRFRPHIHAVELECQGQQYVFIGIHLWRALSMAHFLRAYKVDEGQTEHALWATGLREDVSLDEAAVLEAIPSSESIKKRVHAVVSVASNRARERFGEIIEGVLALEYPAARALADRIVGVAEHLDAGRAAHAESEAHTTALWLESLPTLAPLMSADDLLGDLEGAVMVAMGSWEQATDFAADLELDDDQGALLEVPLAMKSGDVAKARRSAQGLDGDSFFAEALAAAVASAQEPSDG